MVEQHEKGDRSTLGATVARCSVSGAIVSALVLLIALMSGCETVPRQEFSRLRADISYIRRDVKALKEESTQKYPERSDQLGSVQRIQADMNEKITELGTDLQVTQAKVEEARYEIAQLSRKIESLEITLARQIKGLGFSRPTGVFDTSDLQTSGKGRQRTEGPRPDEAFSKMLTSPTARKGVGRPSTGPPEQVSAVLSTPPTTKPSETSVSGAPKAPVSRSIPEEVAMPVVDHVQVYETAYEDYSKGNFELARRAFGEYLRLFPKTDLADNAQYWIGECYYSQGNYQRALEELRKVLENYPEGNKIPNSMLKIGYSLLQMGHQDKAIEIFEKLIERFPLSPETDLAKTEITTLKAQRR